MNLKTTIIYPSSQKPASKKRESLINLPLNYLAKREVRSFAAVWQQTNNAVVGSKMIHSQNDLFPSRGAFLSTHLGYFFHRRGAFFAGVDFVSVSNGSDTLAWPRQKQIIWSLEKCVVYPPSWRYTIINTSPRMSAAASQTNCSRSHSNLFITQRRSHTLFLNAASEMSS
jgi:hypothetical protein